MWLLLVFLIGFIGGIALSYIFHRRKKPSGTFVLDFSDPMKDVCRLELEDSLDDIYNKKEIVFTVKVIEEFAQK